MRSAAAFEPIALLARAAGKSLDWVATGRDEPAHVVTTVREAPEEYVALPLYNVQAAAGAGLVVQGEQIVDWIHFKRDWLRSALGLSPAQLVIVQAVGDSMSPSIEDGDLLLVDIGEPKLRGEGIYVLAVDDALLVKRIAIRLGGGLVISSDNPQYDGTRQEINREDLDRVRLVGRVVWAGGRI